MKVGPAGGFVLEVSCAVCSCMLPAKRGEMFRVRRIVRIGRRGSGALSDRAKTAGHCRVKARLSKLRLLGVAKVTESVSFHRGTPFSSR